MLHPPRKEIIRENIVFRNDDVSYDTDLDRFKEFCRIFHKHGFVQLHGITLRGLTNYTLIQNGVAWVYEEIKGDEKYDYDSCVSVSKAKIEDKVELIEYLNAIPDPIALHGLYHSDYSKMTYEQQYSDIKEGLRILKNLFPNKIINTFIAPFNHVNEYTYKVCDEFGLKVSALEGEHLEDRMHHDKGPLYEGELYRYHHHRFYPESRFDCYNLSLQKLDEYLKKFSYTLISKTDRALPSRALVDACMKKESLDIRISYINKSVECHIMEYFDTDDQIAIFNCGKSLLIHRLWAFGFNQLTGYEDDALLKCATEDISRTIESNIRFETMKLTDVEINKRYKGIVYDGTLQQEKLSIYKVFHHSSKIMDDIGYLIIYGCEENEEQLIDVAGKFNAMLVNVAPYSNEENKVYVFKRIRPKVCLLCDRPGWAHHNSAVELKKYLSDEYDIDIKYVVDEETIKVDDYDAFQVFFWGEKSYQVLPYSKSRVIKQVSSHRWQYDAPYGPIGVEEFKNRYLDDASTVICPSKILYNILKPIVPAVYLCGKGFSEELFKYTQKRNGKMKLCMIGNLKDPVKGLKDLLEPAAEDYILDVAQYIKHDELMEFYNEHDIYVVSSIHEADPLPLIESMACGCFPVASKIGIAPELIVHKVNGYLVEERNIQAFKDAFKWCEENLDYIRERAKLNAEEIYQTRRWEIMAENYRKMFREHIGRR